MRSVRASPAHLHVPDTVFGMEPSETSDDRTYRQTGSLFKGNEPFGRLRKRWAVRRSQGYLDAVTNKGHQVVTTPVWDGRDVAIEIQCLSCRGFDHWM